MTRANQYKCSVCGGVLELSLEAAQAHTDAVDAAGGKPVSIASYFACSKCGTSRTGMTGMTTYILAAANKLRKLPKLTAGQIALHGGISKNAHQFSLDAAVEAVNTGMTALEREHLTLLIANDLVMLLAQEIADDITALLVREMPAQSDVLLSLVDDIERAVALWVSTWAKGEK